MAIQNSAASGGIGGALTIVGISIAGHYGVTVTPEVSAAVGILISTILRFCMRWLPPENPTQAGSNPPSV